LALFRNFLTLFNTITSLFQLNNLGKGKKVAYKFEGNEPEDFFEVTYEELLAQVVKCSAVLRSKGVKKGDVVAIYLPMILELPVAMLGK
jgi:acetyl-CoA synthetase